MYGYTTTPSMEATRRAVLGGLGTMAVGATGATVYGGFTSDRAGTPTALVAGSLLEVASSVEGGEVEAHGSAAARRLVLDGLRDPDAVALADPRLFDGLSQTATLFATNSLVIAYDQSSPHASALQDDWQRALSREGMRVGRTDPDLDPLGYRTVMALRLAETRTAVDADEVLEGTQVVPETEVLNLLEAGELDAAFVYGNMADQRGLPSVSLPTWLNFSDPSAADRYRQVSYELPDVTVRGAPIRYGVVARTRAGQSWVDDLVSDQSRLESFGFTVPEPYPKRNQLV